MKVSGFTFIRNAITYDFPVVEAIRSALPLVDEFVVNVGRSDDDTLNLIKGIGSPKIKTVETVWDDSLRREGKIFGIQQDIALSHCMGDWALLVQADEVLHEDDYPVIRKAMETYLNQSEVHGLVFHMLHFKGDYWSIDPWMYHKATRIVRNYGGVRSSMDGCDFIAGGSTKMIKSGPLGRLINARVFHYGWVRDPNVLKKKLQYQMSRHDGEQFTYEEISLQAALRAEFPTYDILKDYRGRHPALMHGRIQLAGPLRHRKNRWLNPYFYREIVRHGFKG